MCIEVAWLKVLDLETKRWTLTKVLKLSLHFLVAFETSTVSYPFV
jgi:hypothetical protein